MDLTKDRNNTIDLIRGIAVLLMIPANLAGGILVEYQHYFPFRLLFTCAAPLFVFIAGFMAGPKRNNFSYTFKRAGVVLLWAALIDMFIWKLIPFVTYDVLYLIGISTMLMWFLHKLSYSAKYMIGIGILLFGGLSFSLRTYIDYGQITELKLSFDAFLSAIQPQNLIRIFHHFLIDGWFPLLPWLGLFMLGVGHHGDAPKNNTKLIISITMLLSGIISWFFFGHLFQIRDGYSELFYPPQLPFTLVYGGLAGIAGYLILNFPNIHIPYIGNFIKKFGKYSLWIYIFHQVFIEYVFSPLLKHLPLETISSGKEIKVTLIPYLIALIIILISAFFSLKLLEKLKEKGCNSRLLVFKILLGF